MGLLWSVFYMLKVSSCPYFFLMTKPQLKRVHIFQLLYFKGLVNAEVQISVILVIPFFVAAMLVLFSPTTGFLDVDLQPVSCVRR